MYYENGRIEIGAVSFKIPNRVYINPEEKVEIACIEDIMFMDPDEQYLIWVAGWRNCEDSATYLNGLFEEPSCRKIGEVMPITLGGFQGHIVEYTGNKHATNYIEILLDIPEVKGFNALNILYRCDGGTRSHEEMRNEQIWKELLESIKMAERLDL